MENDEAGFRMEEQRERFERIANRHENGTAPRAVSAFQLFQTPAELAERLLAKLQPEIGARVLEPSAGLGRLLDALQFYAPREVVAVEIDNRLTGELFRQNRANVTLKNRDFLTVTPEELGTFDAVVMNPPFHMRADIRHIRHALKFLNPGGKLAAICMNTAQRFNELRELADSWEEIPPGAFRGEGTEVPTVMLTIRKP